MGCGCPEENSPPPSAPFTLIYTSGTEAAYYRMVRANMPETPGKYGIPVVYDDGSVEYPKGTPPDILGYDRIGPRLFRPAWPSCRWRALAVAYPNGCLTVRGQCHNPLSDLHLQTTLPELCKVCSLRTPIPTCQPS